MKRLCLLILALLLCTSCGTGQSAPDKNETAAAGETETSETPAGSQDPAADSSAADLSVTDSSVADSSAADSSVADSSVAETAGEAAETVYEDSLLPYTEEELMKKLGLSVTEGGLSTSRDAIFTRFAEYAAMGVTCVRIDTSWDTSVKGEWKLNASTKNYLDAARENGLLLKLILPTIMAPPSWISSEDGARLEDYNGRKSINTVSYWYDGIEEYCTAAVHAQLKALVDGGWSDVIGGIVVDMGPAGEPLYPPAWTQVSNGLDNSDNGEEVMWCYADNAQADFRVKMEEKYGDIAAANTAWDTSYASFADVSVPLPNTVRDTFWEDTLVWYRDTKRAFMSAQIDIFRSALETYGLSSRPLILYLPGADFTDTQWKNCVRGGNAIDQVKMCCDNEYTVQLAAEKNCLLQYTGITGVDNLRILRAFMFENGYGTIPVFGENAGDAFSAGNPKNLAKIVQDYGLYGIDYTHTRFLYEEDGVTQSRVGGIFVKQVPVLAEYLDTLDLTALPPALKE